MLYHVKSPNFATLSQFHHPKITMFRDFPHVFRHFPPLLTLKKTVPGGPVVPLRLLCRFCFYLLWRFRHRIALATGLEHITLIRFSWRDAGARNMIYIYIY
jgi:hypothetical protein